ncbi:hypothetical protein QJS04_geneDACA022010 [Acorus gramineus]|uniref:Aminotransferase-like plant mobile domain-containing protein n=1 Tax=Acorus gramineus TaxID=55184 RepID=A0AAV9A3D8_ACOGR|nr:hypothetical protein QJS04_geneDACA022010 [Acorus gramineus]
MTITLQDVSILLGLLIEDRAVTGRFEDPGHLCQQLLGRIPPNNQMRGGAIEMGWLRQQFMVVPRRASGDILSYHARAYLLYVLGCTIFCNSTGSHIHSSYLRLLERLEPIYSWGSVALATLYESLTKGCMKKAKTITGCLTLL